jgi:hypothetical protein
VLKAAILIISTWLRLAGKRLTYSELIDLNGGECCTSNHNYLEIPGRDENVADVFPFFVAIEIV